MLAWRRILCPIDFSPPSRRALALALELADKLGAEVTLLHVYNVPAYVVPDGMILAAPDTVREVAARVDAELARWKAETGDRVAVRAAMGGAADEIVTAAKEFDAVVMGTHGRGGLKHALLGSVAEKVVRRSLVPVVTVRLQEG